MNSSCYKIVFSKRLGSLVAVGEHTSGQGKTASGTSTRSSAAHHGLASVLKASTFAIALGLMAHSAYAAGPAATALPKGASVNAGNVAISTQGAAMTIQQSSAKASVNWNSFNIGSAAAVNITQPSANSVLLNRVVGNDPSQIFGKLSANGQVVLINPNGVVFGPGGSVTASAFTASTFGLSDNDFAKGKYNYTRNGSTAGVTVQNGSSLNATAPGGYVALIGASVNNEGTIATKQGSVVMTAGESAALPSTLTDNVSVPLSGKVRLELAPSTLNASVANSGVITTEGGQVLMQAAAISDAVASISHSGSINTTGTQGGAVTLQADGGIIQVNGSIKANSTDAQRVGGDIIIGRDTATGVLTKATDVSGAKLESQGGFVETSGEYLKTSNISVKAAEWLLDPTDITIVATGTVVTDVPSVTSAGTTTFQFTGAGRTDTSEVLKADIESAINNGTNVTLDSRHGTSFGAGNITIATALSFNNTGASNATLRLSAVNGIIQNAGASITGTGTKLVNVVMDTQGRYGGQNVDHTDSKGITLNSTINTNGTVNLTGLSRNTNGGVSSSGVVFNTGAGITASSFTVSGEQAIPSTGVEYAGIYFAGNNTFTSSSGASTMNGSSTSSGIGIGGVFIPDGVTVNFNSGAGSIVVTGSDSNAKGIRFGNTSSSAIVNTTGNVTFDGGNEMFLRAGLRVQSGTASLKGNLVNIYNDGNIRASANTTLNLEGATVSLGSGAYTSIAPSLNANFNLNIKADVISLLNSSTINTGTGTVAVTTKTAGNEIQLGIGSNTGILGLSQANLDSITAGNLVIGDADTTGQITTYTVTTGAATGNLTLRSRGNIALNGALSVGGISGSKNLTLYGSDTVGTNTISEGSSGSIKAAGLELRGSSATHALTSSSNDITTLAGNTQVVNFIDANGFSIGTVNTTGLTTSGNTSLTAGSNASVTQTAAIQAAGLELKGTTASYTLSNRSNDIATLAGNVKTLSYTDATGFAVGAVNTQGLTTSGITTLEAGANGSNASVSQNNIITASGLELKGSQASYTLNGAGAAGNAVSTFAASAKAVAFTNASALSIGTVNTTVGVTTNAGASIMTKSGDLNVNQAIRNTDANVSGDIVIGAGTSTAAGTGSGGDVKTTNGVAITQANTSGKTFIYTGQTSSTGNLSYLNASLANLDLSAIDPGPQNADSNVGYPGNNFGISGSTANAQVMFREKVAIGALLGDTLTKTYGDSSTKSTASSTLFADMQAQLKTKNSGFFTLNGAAAGTLRISNSALIDTLSGSLTPSSPYNSSGYLNANSSGYGYDALTSSKYTYSLAANDAKVVVKKATAKLSAQRDYNGTTALSNVSIDTGVIGANGLETLTFSSASSNNKNVSSNGSNFITAITLANGGNGGDASNYTYINSYDSVYNHVTINRAALSVTANAVTKTYDGTVNAEGTGTVGTLAGAGDFVYNTGAQTYLDKNYGINDRRVRAYGVSIKDTFGTDVTSNYNISYIDNVVSTINQAALTIKVNDTSMFVTQDARTATNQLYSYSGFKNGETAANALTGGALVAANRSYTDPANTLVAYHPTAGSYSGVYGLTAAPTAVNNNYAITVQNGNLRVIPADKLLITIASQVDSYGNRTAANAGLASNGSVSAQYCLVPSNCTGSNLVDLTLTKLNGTEWKATDSSGSSVMFSTTLTSPSYSTGGYVSAGNYTYDTTQISPLSLPNGNFTGRETNGGVLTINPVAANLSSSSASKVYDGTTDISGVSLALNNLQSGDAVKGTIGLGTLASKNADSNVSATFSGISLSGLDAANYYLTSTTLVGSATVTPKPLTLIGATVGNKTFDGNTSASITSNGTLSGLVGVETLTLFGLTGTFDSASVGQGKTVKLTATLLDGSNGGLASNYSLAPATALADINVASSNQATPLSPVVHPTKPVLPNTSAGSSSRASTSPIANPYVSLPQPHADNAERCSLNANNSRKAIEGIDDYAGCLCETQNTLGIDGLSICYEPKQTADNKTNRKPRI